MNLADREEKLKVGGEDVDEPKPLISKQ